MPRPLKYNPSFLSDDELLTNFCVRRNELDALVACVRKNATSPNVHTLLTGVRGSGKTMLLRRFAVEIKNDPALSSLWQTVMFSEENYEILSLDDFWLQTLYYLSPAEYEEIKVRGGHRSDTGSLELARILDFSDRTEKKILLICENMNDLFDTLPSEDLRQLKNTLQAESRIMLAGSSTIKFDIEHPFYCFFKTLPLARLSCAECEDLWLKVAEKKISSGQARALEILTGGSPRLLSVLAWFGRDLSFIELMKELEMLIDDHTDYFKGQMEALPPKERKVFATLARLWINSTSAEVAVEARMEQTETASLLSRLVRRGIVEEFPPEGGKKRGKTFQLSERLFNIYYLMRLGGRSSLWVRPVVEFLAQVFGTDVAMELFRLDYSVMDQRALRCAAMLMLAVDFGETIDREAEEHFKNGDIPKAFDMAQKAWETQAKALGEEHPATLKALNHMATAFLVVGEQNRALELSIRAYTAMTRLLGREHLDTLCALGNLCNIYAHKGDYEKSLALAQDLFGYPEFLAVKLQYANMLCTALAAISPEVAEMTLRAIEKSPSCEILNVLSAGIKTYLGVEFRAPQEVREIAEDIKGWIENMARRRQSSSS